MTLSTDMSKTIASFICILIFMKNSNFMLMRVEHEIKCMGPNQFPLRNRLINICLAGRYLETQIYHLSDQLHKDQ